MARKKTSHWRRMGTTIEQCLREARFDKLDDAARKLRTAEHLARNLPGGATLRTSEGAAPEVNPVQEYRKLLVHDLLLWQARRTYQDHWYSEDGESNRPFYRDTGALYVDAAQALIGGDSSDLTEQQKQDRQAKVREVRELVNQQEPLKAQLRRPSRPDFTGGSEIKLEFAVDRGASVPRGYPVAWLRAPGAEGRQVLDLQKEAHTELPFTIPPFDVAGAKKRVERLDTTFAVYFRGQLRPVPQKVNVYLQPDIVWAQPKPPP